MMGVIYASTFGLFWIGVFFDMATLKAQVAQANAERSTAMGRRGGGEDGDALDDERIDAMIHRYRLSQQPSPVAAAATTQRGGFGRRR